MNQRSPKPWNWSLGAVTLEVRHQNLLNAPEMAWVNSENSAFLMAWNRTTVSGQLNARFPFIQEELLTQTTGAALAPGTCLRTSGPGGRAVFHAGFHHPNDWALGNEDLVAKHASMIRRCVEDILESAANAGIDSVAFPMIGTGAFGLPVPVFARLFFEAVAMFGRRTSRPIKVALCIWEFGELEEVVRYGTQVLGALVGGGRSLLRDAGGHRVVQNLRPLAKSLADEQLQERNLLHFAEIGLMTDLAVFYDVEGTSPKVLIDSAKDRSAVNLTFGFVRSRIDVLKVNCSLPDWLSERFELLTRESSRGAIARIVKDRNDHAHNRRPRPVDAIIEDIEMIFGPEALPTTWPDDTASRWIRLFPEGFGLLDGIDTHRRRCSWLIPDLRHRVHEGFESLEDPFLA